MTPPGDGSGRACASCGQPLAPGAAFCRSCGAPYEPAVAAPTMRRAGEPPGPGGTRRNRVVLWVAAAIVLAGAGAAAAILVASGGDSSSTTVLVDSGTTTETELASGGEGVPSAGALEGGRYVQAGSFKTTTNAEIERERLVGEGIDVEVVSSNGAQELYPGFQVLLAGPFETGSEEASTVKLLRGNGVPSAFARDLSPALAFGDPADIAGSWSGALDRSSGERPRLNGTLPVSLELDSDGRTGALEFENGCRDELTLSEAGEATLSYTQSRGCAANSDLLVRPAGGQLMLSVLPLDSDTLVLGSLSPG
jgi:hypothetical protein